MTDEELDKEFARIDARLAALTLQQNRLETICDQLLGRIH